MLSTIVCSRSCALLRPRGVKALSVRGRVTSSRMTGAARRRAGPDAGKARSRAAGIVLAYLALTKPRVIELLLVTAIPAMLLADRGHVSPLLILNTLIGGMMAAGGANTLNCVADADIDKVMKRTARRPLAREAVPRRNALVLGLVLSIGSFFWLWWTTNLLSGLLAVATIAFYVFVYTLLLKRRTSQNVVWGGAAGCMPVMIGWSAVTGGIGWPALAMFAIIFLWTPPHTWALAMRYKEDYKAAGVPMLPAVATERQVTKQILVYTWLTVLATLALALATGWLYAAVAVVAGVWFLAMAHQLYAGVRAGEPVKPLRLFLQSNNYLALVFCALAVDSVIALPTLI
ncbi:protoheme IX farnesyltransferase [Mycobacterium sp. 852002-51163_SCH5372311]|nr:protoheme IX farnesyltransferase [Mycobacterium sp. 852002-51163_SCH5372311]